MKSLGDHVHENAGGEYRTWEVQEAITGHEQWNLILVSGDRKMFVKETELLDRISTDQSSAWYPGHLDPRHRLESMIPEAEPNRVSDYDEPLNRQVVPRKHASDLIFQQIEGTRKPVNEFLDTEIWVDHDLGSVTFDKARFGAFSPYDGSLVGVVVLHKPAAPSLDDWNEFDDRDVGTRIEVKRLAARNYLAPHCTASWMLSKAGKWAKQQGAEIIQAYSGMAGNPGTCYKGAGFEPARIEADADGNGWNTAASRDGRVAVQGGQQWDRTRWERSL